MEKFSNTKKGMIMRGIGYTAIGIILVGTCKVAAAELEIFCPKCKKHLYNYRFDDIRVLDGVFAEDFIPASNDIPQPDDKDPMVCPICSAPLNGYEFWFWFRGKDIPRFAFPAMSLYIRDKDGNFKWFPDDILMDEDVDAEKSFNGGTCQSLE